MAAKAQPAASAPHRKLSDYEGIVDPDILEEIYRLGKRLKGMRMLHVNSTKRGGGVAELLSSLLPLFNDVGLQADWQVITAPPEFFQVTKLFHNALQGLTAFVTPQMFDLYLRVVEENVSRLNLDADVVVIHDYQPLTLVEHRSKQAAWIWRCHIDLSRSASRVCLTRPEKSVWDLLSPYVAHYEEAIFSLTEFAQNLPVRQHIIPPSIDPLTEKNQELDAQYITEVYQKLGIPRDRKVFLQVSRFDRFKDPVGVIQAYQLFREKNRLNHSAPTCLVLAGGGADDDPEGALVLEEVRARSKGDPDIHILELPPTAHLEINALQRGADIIIQKSTREGFGLVVTEALWKKKPVIASAAGGIKIQVLDGLTGFLVNSAEELADRLEYLLQHPRVGERLGQNGYKHARQNFLIPRQLRDYLRVLSDRLHP